MRNFFAIFYLKKIFFFLFLMVFLFFFVNIPIPKKLFKKSLDSLEKTLDLKIVFKKAVGNCREIQLYDLEIFLKKKKVLSMKKLSLQYSYRSLFLGYPISVFLILNDFQFLFPVTTEVGLKSLFSKKITLIFKGHLQNKNFYGLGDARIESLKLSMHEKVMNVLVSILGMASDKEDILINELSFKFDKNPKGISFSKIVSSQEDFFDLHGVAMYQYSDGIYSIFILKKALKKESFSKKIFSVYGVPSNLKFKKLNE